MADPLRTLLVAGDPKIARVLARALVDAGLDDGIRTVRGIEELERLLGPDVALVVCAGREGAPAAPEVVPVVRAADPDLPVLVVGGGPPVGGDPIGVVRVGPGEARGTLGALVRHELSAAVSRRTARAAADAVHVRERALDVATSGVLVADATQPHRPIVYVNSAFERLLGWSREELLGRGAELFVGGNTEPELTRALAASVQAGTAHEATINAHRRDGSSFRAQVTLTPSHDEAGRLVQWIAVVDDVTERARVLDRLAIAEDREGALLADLAAAQARYQNLVERIPAVAYVARFDERSTLQYVSPQIEQLLGWPAEAFLADQDLWYRCIHEEDRARIIAAEAHAWAHGDSFEAEFRMVARDGRELWVWDRDQLIAGEDGATAYTQGVLVDVTPMRRAESALADERHRAQRYLDVAGAVIVILDERERVSLLNRAGRELLGYEEGDLQGRDWFEAVVPEPERDAARAVLHDVLSGIAEDAVHEHVVITRDGEERAVAWRHTVVRDEQGRATATVSSGVDLTERRSAEQQIAYLAYHDSLTGLPNRALLHEHLELALARARRQETAVALLYLDLDGFKLVNDSLGHPAGDELLCHVTMRLSERRRNADLLARQGGDEFLLLLADLDRSTAEHTARRVAESLLRSLGRPFHISGAEFHIGASIGISLFPRDAADADQLLRHADASMYDAKANGRNGINLYSGESHEPLERLSMTSRLRKAVMRNEFVLYWQPIVDPASGAMIKVEALIRWQDPFRGLVLPGEFIGFAEETGFIDRVGDWVVAEVCQQLIAWDRAGLTTPRVTLNVSPRQLRRPDFGDRLLQALSRQEGLADRVTVEITESAAMADPQRTDPVLRELAESGVEIAVDDFGAGYSSLTRLRRMPVQVLKIDRTFLQGVPEDPEATAIVTAIIELASALGMEAVAEGVETEAQREFLVQRGCPLAQGYLLGLPVPAHELERRLTRAGSLRRPGGDS
jgi:diguanylate cyclase (GGDEF)-like protein/PAS domain S-box-containing protein